MSKSSSPFYRDGIRNYEFSRNLVHFQLVTQAMAHDGDYTSRQADLRRLARALT